MPITLRTMAAPILSPVLALTGIPGLARVVWLDLGFLTP